MYFSLLVLAAAISGATAQLCGSTYTAKCADGSTQTPLEVVNGVCNNHVCANNGGATDITSNTQVGEDCSFLVAYNSLDCSGAENAATSDCAARGHGLTGITGGLQSFKVTCAGNVVARDIPVSFQS